MYSGDTTKYLESFSAEILIPNNDMPREGNYKFTTYGSNSYGFPVEESTTKNPGYHTFSFDLTKDELKFRPYNEYIEFDLVTFGEDKHILSEHASINDYYNDDVLWEIEEEQNSVAREPSIYRAIKLIVFFVCLSSSVFVIIRGRGKIHRLKTKYPFYESEQTFDVYRDIPSDLDPKFASDLVFCKDKKKKRDSDGAVYSAILLSLSRKQCIELQEVGTDDIMITIKESKPSAPVSVAESTNCDYFTEELESDGPTGYVLFVDSYPQEDTQLPFEAYVVPREEHSLKSFYSSEPSELDLHWSNDQVQKNVEQSIESDSLDSFSSPEQPDTLTMCERYYLNMIKRHTVGGSITMSKLRKRIESDCDYTRNFIEDMNRSTVNIGVGYRYFQKADWREPEKKLYSSAKLAFVYSAIFALVNFFIWKTRLDMAFGGFVILSISQLVNGIYLKNHAHKYVLLTKFGENEYQKWRGLYNFLKSDTLMNERTVVELPIWEKYLVYATAFGISEKVISAIRIRCPSVNTDSGENSIVYSSYCRSGRIYVSGRRFHASVRSGYRTSISNSLISHIDRYGGSNGVFGYGGGGRGGGGGGGGH